MADLEFFFDPICPWAWITSRLTVEVARQRDLTVDWRFICLRMVNEEKDYDREFPPGYVNAHRAGQRMLRIAAAARRDEGNAAVDALYTAFGEQLHTAGRSEEIRDGDDQSSSESRRAGRPAAGARRRRRRRSARRRWCARRPSSPCRADGQAGRHADHHVQSGDAARRPASSDRWSPGSLGARRRCGSGTRSSCSPARPGSPSSSARREIVRRLRSGRGPRRAGDPPFGQPQEPGDEGHRPDNEEDLVPSALVSERWAATPRECGRRGRCCPSRVMVRTDGRAMRLIE